MLAAPDDPTPPLPVPPLPPLPPGVRARPATWDDLDAVLDLEAACSRDRTGRVTVRRGDLAARWLGLDRIEDVLLLEAGPEASADTVLVASAELQVDVDPFDGEVRSHVEARVHPQHTGRGLGSLLLEHAADRASLAARAAGAAAATLTTSLVDGDDRARAFAARRGFAPIRHLLTLRLDLHAAPPAPVWPPGVQVRRLRPGRDEEAAWRTHQRAFADVETSLPLGFEDWVADRLREGPGFDPDLVLLVDADDEPDPVAVAVCRSRTDSSPEDGWVRDLGVVPAWRRRGVAMALLRETFAALRVRGSTGVALEVDDVTIGGAVALYRRAGMRIVQRTDVVERTVPAAPPTLTVPGA